MEQWKQVLTDNPNFHRLPPPDRSDTVEEETYEYELAYMRLLVEFDERVRERANQIAHGAHAVVPFLTEPFPPGGAGDRADRSWPSDNKLGIKWWVAENTSRQVDFADITDENQRKAADFSSPFVKSLTPKGEPWVREDVKESVRQQAEHLPRKEAARRARGATVGPHPGGRNRPGVKGRERGSVGSSLFGTGTTEGFSGRLFTNHFQYNTLRSALP